MIESESEDESDSLGGLGAEMSDRADECVNGLLASFYFGSTLYWNN